MRKGGRGRKRGRGKKLEIGSDESVYTTTNQGPSDGLIVKHLPITTGITG